MSAVRALEALADPTRREIVDLLAGGELDAGTIASRFPVSRPAVSRHLRVLREAGLVKVRPDAQRRVYALDPAPLAELDAWLARYRAFWANRLDALDVHLRRERRREEP
jgi:DNA-binding transcriptional ArsR family regulator